jgi:membrane protein DedA with SNARE-associated domain
MEKAVRILVSITLFLIILAGWSCGWGTRFKMKGYSTLGVYILALAVALGAIATVLWAISWIRKNVKIR